MLLKGLTVLAHLLNIDDQNETISNIEVKQNDVATKLTEIEEAIQKIDAEIKAIDERRKPKGNDINDNEAHDNSITKCKFDNLGFCKANISCKFYHAEKECEFYLNNGYCNKMLCRERHPKKCYFFERGYCFRGESCRYLHGELRLCNRCENNSTDKFYFCEFCKQSYCSLCTVEDAHVVNIYDADGPKGCNQIHL